MCIAHTISIGLAALWVIFYYISRFSLTSSPGVPLAWLSLAHLHRLAYSLTLAVTGCLQITSSRWICSGQRETYATRSLYLSHTPVIHYKFSRSRFRVRLHKCEGKCNFVWLCVCAGFFVYFLFLQIQSSWRMLRMLAKNARSTK